MTGRFTSGQIAGAFFLRAAILGSVAVILLAAEFYARHAVATPEMRRKGAEAMWISYGNSFLMKENGETSGCGWEETLVPHPYLGWVNSVIPPCVNDPTNNIGMPDPRDYPLARDPNYFSIALVGGSVSSLMVIERKNWLEEALEKRFVSPNGKPFRVFNGAMGASSYPTQLNFLVLYGDVMDAVVGFDGYNELKPNRAPLTRPNSSVYLYAARPWQMGWKYDAFLSLRHIREFVLSVPVLRHSFLLYFSYRQLLASARAQFEEDRYYVTDRYFELPEEWSDQKVAAWNRDKYRTYILQLKGMAETLGLKYAHFVQPVPEIGKELTPEERGHLSAYFNKDYYREVIVGPSLELRKKGVQTLPLTEVFAQERGTVYADAIHYAFQGPAASRGYELVAAAMAEEIGRAWHLKRKLGAHQ